MKRANLEKILLNFSKGEKNLNKILSTQKISFNEDKIGFNPSNKNIIKTSLLNRLTTKVRFLLLAIIVAT